MQVQTYFRRVGCGSVIPVLGRPLAGRGRISGGPHRSQSRSGVGRQQVPGCSSLEDHTRHAHANGRSGRGGVKITEVTRRPQSQRHLAAKSRT